jgi:hypothetical protein
MEAPAGFGAHHFHAGLGGEGVEATAVFGGDGGAADDRRISGGGGHGLLLRCVNEL